MSSRATGAKRREWKDLRLHFARSPGKDEWKKRKIAKLCQIFYSKSALKKFLPA